jgi:hypothetical protein
VAAAAAAGCGSTAASKRTTSSPVAHPPVPSAQVEGALLTAIKTTRGCIAKRGLHVSGGPVYPQQSPSSPDGELIVGNAKGGGLIAFYTTASRAQQLAPEVQQSARRSGGEVERSGAVTVLLVHHPSDRLRQIVLTCAFP